jgi:uncharacterized protein (TIGR02246 family)
MRPWVVVLPWLLPVATLAAGPQDEAAIRKLVDDEVTAWNAGDARAYAGRFSQDGSMTNIGGQVMYGHEEFEKVHARIFSTVYKGSRLKMSIGRLRFVTPEVAIVDANVELGNITGTLAIPVSADGVLHTRLLQVLVKREGAWWIEAYHNVAVRPPTAGPPLPPTATPK